MFFGIICDKIVIIKFLMTEREIMKYIDFICRGLVVLSLGLYNAGLHGIFAVERNKDAFSTLKYNLIERKKHFHGQTGLK